ncbi:MAG: hypothetical protein R3E08_07840 [Thiotrichaceae bacterium]
MARRQALEEKRSLSITMIVSPGYAPLEQYDNVRTEQGVDGYLRVGGRDVLCDQWGNATSCHASRQ